MNFSKGYSIPRQYGAVIYPEGVQFRIFSRHAKTVWLMFFKNPEDLEPSEEIELVPEHFREGDLWQVFVRDVKPGQMYLYRMGGRKEPGSGHRFDSRQWLLDPYAMAVTRSRKWGDHSFRSRFTDNEKDYKFKLGFHGFPKCVIIDDSYDWKKDERPATPLNDMIIYEAHVRGLTVHPSSACSDPGTFKGVIDIIPHLKELGITTLELLPVQEFNELENKRKNPHTGEPLVNYWGYSTSSFFAPNSGYCRGQGNGEQILQFKDMVKALHKAGIEILLDVVFNHTAEGDGVTVNFKGIDNPIYYHLEEKKSKYKNFTGCGNSFNCNHPVARKFIVSSLEYWYSEMHVDGFRFDLASTLCRGTDGELLGNPPLIEEISESPILKNAKLIAEAWDMYAYQVGSFPGKNWLEWNGRYRDDVRAFLNGDAGKRGAFASRITGSSDIYSHNGGRPSKSVNFITSHDGFTLNDLVSYRQKHNKANGERNRDGDNNNISVNFGYEGVTDNILIKTKRLKQIKNYFTTLMLSQGIPMFPAGDEFRRSQQGNNNPYCQDNEISWIDWSLKEKNLILFNFCRKIIAFRKAHPVFRRKMYFTGEMIDKRHGEDICWYDIDGSHPVWEKDALTLAYL
ncbi:MAG: glycogen debranching protein GlgX, partial [bacterium]|nr:glycogen debranching protein GlgX [bacterium]